MNWRWIRLKLQSLFHRQRAKSEVREELDFHAEMQIRKNLRLGMTPEEAKRQARIKFGSAVRVEEECREARGMNLIEDLLRDLRYAAATLIRNPAFTLVAVLSLALGIGAINAILTVTDNVLLRRPGFEHLDRLVYLVDDNPQEFPPGMDVPPSPGNFLDWRRQVRTLDRMAAWRNWYYTFSDPQNPHDPELLRGVRVTPSFFEIVGTRIAHGRSFEASEDQSGYDRVVIISDRLWKRRFAGDSNIIGRKVTIDGQPLTLIGILPSEFRFFQSDFELWMPLVIDADSNDRRSHSINVYARLAPGASAEQAQAELQAVARRLASEHPDTNSGLSVRIVPLWPTPGVRALRPAVLILVGAAGFVLLIACANVANLLLARAFMREREIAIRAAIGATRGRLIRQTLVESSLVAVLSALAGLLITPWIVEELIPLLPHASLNQTIEGFVSIRSGIDWRLVGLSIMMAITTTILCGLLPALKNSKPGALRISSASLRSMGGRFFMVGEIACAFSLLVGAGLLLQSFWKLQKIDPGFRSDHLLTMQLWLPRTKYSDPVHIRSFYEQLVRRIQMLPQVQTAGAVSFVPFGGMGMSAQFSIEGRVPQLPHDVFAAEYRVITPGYLRLLRQSLIKGREFTETDGPDSEGVAIVNQAMAQRFWPGENPIGKHFRPDFSKTDVPWAVDSDPKWLTVVGVSGNIKEYQLNRDTNAEFYVSSSQFPSSLMFMLVRTATIPHALVPSIQAQIRAVDPEQPMANVRTMDETIASALPRFNLTLLAVFAFIATLLSAIGIYGVTTYAVNRRRREIAIRLALGAHMDGIVAMILREGMALAGFGVAIGGLAALSLTPFMSSLLYGIGATDVTTFTAVSAVVIVVTLASCYLPARNASRVDPLTNLRADQEWRWASLQSISHL